MSATNFLASSFLIILSGFMYQIKKNGLPFTDGFSYRDNGAPSLSIIS